MGTIDIIISMMGTRLWKITDEPMYVFWRYVTSCSWWINLQINSTHWKVIVRQIIRIIQPRWCRLVSHCLMATKSIKRNVDTRIQLSGLQSLFWRKQTVSVAAHTYIYIYTSAEVSDRAGDKVHFVEGRKLPYFHLIGSDHFYWGDCFQPWNIQNRYAVMYCMPLSN